MSDNSVCADYRDSLAAYAAGLLPLRERQQIEEHLAQCEQCSIELAQWRRIGKMAREIPVPTPMPAFSDAWEQLRQELASERMATVTSHAEQRQLREVELDDVLSAPPSGAYRAMNPTISTKAARGTPRMKFARSLMAIAAVLILAVVSAAVFSTLPRQRHGGGVAAQTAACSSGQISAQLPPYTQLSDFTMTSPNDGWAVGFSTSPAEVDEPLMLRYQDCSWAPVSVPALKGFDNYTLSGIAMVSPNEGWAIGGPGSAPVPDSRLLLHYAHGQWQRVTLPSTIASSWWFTKVVMISPDEGWLLANMPPQTFNPQYKWTNMLIHYVKGVWSVVTPPFPFIGDIAAVAPDDLFISGAQENQDYHSLLGHYHDGSWTTTPAPGLHLGTLSMLSLTDGWAIAVVPNPSNLDELDQLAPLHYDGKNWGRANLGMPTNTNLYEMGILSDTDMWAFNGGSSYHLDHGHWQMVPFPEAPGGLTPATTFTIQTMSSVSPLVRTGAGDYWMLATYPTGMRTDTGVNLGLRLSVFMHYTHGAWTAYGAPPNA